MNSSGYIESGGVQYVYGDAYYDTIERYGVQYVESSKEPPTARRTTGTSTSTAPPTPPYVESGARSRSSRAGGLAYEPFVYSGGYRTVYSGGKTEYGYIYAGATQYNYRIG